MLWKLDVERKQRGLHRAYSGDVRIEEYEETVFSRGHPRLRSIFRPLHPIFFSLAFFFLPQSRVISNFTFPVSAVVEPLLTAFSRFSVPYLPFHDSTHPLTRPLFLSFRCRIVAIYLPVYAVRSGRFQEHACGQFQPFNDTSEKFWRQRRKRKTTTGGIILPGSLLSLQAFEPWRPWKIFKRRMLDFLLARVQKLCTGMCIMHSSVRSKPADLVTGSKICRKGVVPFPAASFFLPLLANESVRRS